MRSLVTRTPMQTGYGGVRHVAVSLAHVPALVDGVKYMEPPDVPRLEGSQLRRAPPLRFLVKLAVRYESAKELGKRLRRRYQRQLQRGAMSRQEGSPSIFREIRHGSRRRGRPEAAPTHNLATADQCFLTSRMASAKRSIKLVTQLSSLTADSTINFICSSSVRETRGGVIFS